MRLFVAINIPDNIRNEIKNIQKSLDFPELKIVEPKNLHITIKFLGEVGESLKDKIIEVLRGIKFQKFEIGLSNIGVFPNEKYIKVIWIGCQSSELVEFTKRVDMSLSKLGFELEKDYVPHLTLARVKKKPDEKLFKELNKIEGKFVGNFIVNDFLLKKSTLTRSGPIYEDIERFELDKSGEK